MCVCVRCGVMQCVCVCTCESCARVYVFFFFFSFFFSFTFSLHSPAALGKRLSAHEKMLKEAEEFAKDATSKQGRLTTHACTHSSLHALTSLLTNTHTHTHTHKYSRHLFSPFFYERAPRQAGPQAQVRGCGQRQRGGRRLHAKAQ